jgi:hypothetical protein
MAFEIKGKLEVIYDEAQVTEKFKKREFVLMVQDGMYPDYPKFQVTQDKCSLLNSFKAGDEVIVSFNLRGRPSTKNGITTYFTNLDAWKIVPATEASVSKPASSASSSPTSTKSNTPPPVPQGSKADISGMTFTEATDDELPF